VTAFRIEKLGRQHVLESFDCGKEPLNRFLVRHAMQNQQASASQTYLGLADDEVIGFYTLVVGEVAFAEAPERLHKGFARHPVPIMLLARLAVGASWHGRGVGEGLLKDAMLHLFMLMKDLKAAGQ
jgi:predicted N-acetyltransferase YhbS